MSKQKWYESFPQAEYVKLRDHIVLPDGSTANSLDAKTLRKRGHGVQGRMYVDRGVEVIVRTRGGKVHIPWPMVEMYTLAAIQSKSPPDEQ